MTDQQYEAGERLRADYWYAHLSPRVTANWSGFAPSSRVRRGAPSHTAALTDNAIAAKQRVGRALHAVGPELAGVLVDVCCELKGLEEAEKVNGWPQRAGKVVLQLALTRLARCQAGQIMATVDLLQRIPHPTDADIDANITNICRCGTYARIRKAVHKAADLQSGANGDDS